MKSQKNMHEDEYLKKIEKQIKWSIVVAAALILIVLISYFANFHGKFDSDSGTWGTFGDFVGGTLNPVLAALAFYWLTSSIRLQIQELRDTRNVLQETATHQEEIANLEKNNVETQQALLNLQQENLKMQIQASKIHQNQIAIQNFENIFFELLKTKNDAVNNIVFEPILRRGDFYSGKEAIYRYMESYKNNDYYRTWQDYYVKELINSFGSYFRICYQIVRLIEENEALDNEVKFQNKQYSLKQKLYFDIFKSTLTQSELESLFFNGLNNYNKFKRILEKYGAFEPLLMEDGFPRKINSLTNFAYKYNQTAFEKNPDYLEYFSQIKRIKNDLDIAKVEFCIETILELDFEKLYLNRNSNAKKNGEDFRFTFDFFKDYVGGLKGEMEDDTSKSEIILWLEKLDESNELENLYILIKYNIKYKDYVEYCNLLQ